MARNPEMVSVSEAIRTIANPKDAKTRPTSNSFNAPSSRRRLASSIVVLFFIATGLVMLVDADGIESRPRGVQEDATPQTARKGSDYSLERPSAPNVFNMRCAKASGKQFAELDTSVYSALRPELEHC